MKIVSFVFFILLLKTPYISVDFYRLHEFSLYSRGQKNRDTRCYFDTYHRTEMKLVPLA